MQSACMAEEEAKNGGTALLYGSKCVCISVTPMKGYMGRVKSKKRNYYTNV